MSRAAVLVLAIAAAPACAAGDSPAGTLGALAQSVAALGIVVIAILAAGWALRRLQRGIVAGEGPLRPVGAIAVGARERVVIVEIQDVWLVLGVAPGAVRVIHTLPRAATTAAPADQGFASWLHRVRRAEP